MDPIVSKKKRLCHALWYQPGHPVLTCRIHFQTTLAVLIVLFVSMVFHASAVQDSIPAQPSWTADQAWVWYRRQPWIVGFNYVPSTAANTTEFWSAQTFDANTIDRELGWGSSLGFNSCRVFVQYLVWKSDPTGLKKRLGEFFTLASRHGLTTTLVLFDDCAFGDPPQTEPYLGKQRAPIPGMILPSWTPSPGLKAVTDRAVCMHHFIMVILILKICDVM